MNIPEVIEYLKIVENDKSPFTLRSYSTSLEQFFSFSKSNSLNDIKEITPKTCRDFQTYLLNSGIAKSSINAYLRPVKVFFNWLIENEYIESSPFEKVKFLKEGKKVLTVLTEEETFAVVNSCKKLEEKLIMAMFLTLGLRRSELANLRMNQITNNAIKVEGKGSKERYVYLPDDVYALYQEYLNKRKDKSFPYLFRSKMGNKYSTEALRQKVKKAAFLAGIEPSRIEKISCHTLRRTCATNLVENNTDIRIIQGVLGHSNLNTTLRYANLRNSAIEKAMISQKRILQ